MEEKKAVIAKILQSLQRPISGYRWDDNDETLFIVSEDEEMKPREVSPHTIT